MDHLAPSKIQNFLSSWVWKLFFVHKLLILTMFYSWLRTTVKPKKTKKNFHLFQAPLAPWHQAKHMVLIAHLDSPFFPLLIHLFCVSAHMCTFTRSNPISGKLLNRNITLRLSCHADVIDPYSACICSSRHVALIRFPPSAKRSLKVRR